MTTRGLRATALPHGSSAHVVGDPARVVQEMAKADTPALRVAAPAGGCSTVSSRPSPPSATSCMTTVATKLLVTLPTQNRSSGRAFRRAAVGETGGDDGASAVLLEQCDHGRELARGDEPVGGALELGLGRWSGAGHERDRESGEQAHVPRTRRAAPALQVSRSGCSACKKLVWRIRQTSRCRLLPPGRRGSARGAGARRATTTRTRRSSVATSAWPIASPPRSPARPPTAQEAVQNAYVKAHRSLRSVPRRGRVQAVAAPDRRQRGTQRAALGAAARAARRARGREARGGRHGRRRVGRRARGGRVRAAGARAPVGRGPARASRCATSRSCRIATPPRSWACRQAPTASASCARSAACARLWRETMTDRALELRLRRRRPRARRGGARVRPGRDPYAPPRRRRVRRAIAAALALAAVAGAAVAPAAVSALGRFFGVEPVPGARACRAGRRTAVPRTARAAEAEASASVPFRIRTIGALGNPDAFHVRDDIAGGMVTVAYGATHAADASGRSQTSARASRSSRRAAPPSDVTAGSAARHLDRRRGARDVHRRRRRRSDRTARRSPSPRARCCGRTAASPSCSRAPARRRTR